MTFTAKNPKNMPVKAARKPVVKKALKLTPFSPAPIPAGCVAVSHAEPYAELKRVLNQAFDSQTKGKAKERHNQTGLLPFEQQRIMTISETIRSPHGLTYQVTKKMLEALEMTDFEKTIHELQGAMVYLGALILYVERQELRKTPTTV